MKTANTRITSARILSDWLRTGTFVDRLLAPVTHDRAFVMEVVYGAVKWKRKLNWVIRRCSRRAPDPDIRAHLLVGLYQILVMTDVANYAAVNETVEAAKAISADAAKFVNAVLRRVIREQEEIEQALAQQSLGIRLSHPDLLLRRWQDRYGAHRTQALCEWNNDRADVTIRVNTQRMSMSEYRARLQAASVDAEPHPTAQETCLILARGVRITELPGYAEGYFSVQDASTMRAVDLLDPRPGEEVLDACAAPGGKTVAMAERMCNRGRLLAMDVQTERLSRLRENLKHMGSDWIRVRQGDATRGEADFPRGENTAFDAVLLDVPCSNTGVLRRRPDARWRFSPKRLSELVQLQHDLLDGVAPLVKPGGRLVYSTCSLEPEEGDALIHAWLSEQPAWRYDRDVVLFPPESRTDGIYAVRLRNHCI